MKGLFLLFVVVVVKFIVVAVVRALVGLVEWQAYQIKARQVVSFVEPWPWPCPLPIDSCSALFPRPWPSLQRNEKC